MSIPSFVLPPAALRAIQRAHAIADAQWTWDAESEEYRHTSLPLAVYCVEGEPGEPTCWRARARGKLLLRRYPDRDQAQDAALLAHANGTTMEPRRRPLCMALSDHGDEPSFAELRENREKRIQQRAADALASGLRYLDAIADVQSAFDVSKRAAKRAIAAARREHAEN